MFFVPFFRYGSMCLELRGFPGVAGSLRDTGGVFHPGCGRMEYVAPL